MSKKTITKKISFVIFLISLCCIFSGCFAASSGEPANAERDRQNFSAVYEKPEIAGIIKNEEITESSGIAASKCQENVFWTHNDSGGGSFVFAIDGKGAKLGTWRVTNAKNVDWEDLGTLKNANGECFLYIGDIGDNERRRDDLAIYLVKEPTVSDESKNSSKINALLTDSAEDIKIKYPDSRHDAETLIVHPQTGDIYVLTKHLRDAAGVYKLRKNYTSGKVNRLEKIAAFTVPSVPGGFLTGGGVSSDGKRVIVCDYLGAYEIVLSETAKDFDEIWGATPSVVNLGERKQGEAIGYAADDKAVYATSEKRNAPLIRVARK